MSIKQKQIINIGTLGLVTIFAVYYFIKHPHIFSELNKLPVYLFVFVLLLNFVLLLIISRLFITSLMLNKVKMPFKSSLILNSNSIFLNFFIPGQAGPIYRGYYLKEKHNLKVVDYTLSTLAYYAVFALISVNFILLGYFKLKIGIPLVILSSAIFYLITIRYLKIFTKNRLFVNHRILIDLLAVTFLQILISSVVYFLELHFISHNIGIYQTLTYTGIACLSLFVSLTPAGIGIREAFLIFSQQITGVNTNQVVLASVVDRSVFVVFLSLIGIYILYQKYTNHEKILIKLKK